MARNLSSVRYPLFFVGLFIIEIGGLLYHFLKIPVNELVVFAAVGFIVYFLSIAAPWSSNKH
jgi:hypothetical protein